jgi:transcriptional regulator with XRE-family HTH domain
MRAETAPPDPPLTFAAWVRREREARGWTQKALATQAGIAEITVQKAEGGRPPSTDLLLGLLGAFGIPVEQHEAYLGWIVGLRAAPPTEAPPPAEPSTGAPVPPPADAPVSADLAPDLAAQLLARLLPALLRQQTEAANTLELRLAGLLLYDRALARQEAAEWEAYREQTREATDALRRYTLLLLGLGLLLGVAPTGAMAALVVVVGGLGIAWKRLEGIPDRVSQAAIVLTSVLFVSTVAVATWTMQPLLPLVSQLAPLFFAR